METNKLTEEQFLAKLAALGDLDEDQRKTVTCALIGHSRIQSTCFGYYYCARCEAQVGDTLGGSYPGASNAVIIGHDCELCRTNFAGLGWQDKLFTPEPFKCQTTK